jgi:hypothetical protein
MSRFVCMLFDVDLIACKLSCFLHAVACRPVTPSLWRGFLVAHSRDYCAET